MFPESVNHLGAQLEPALQLEAHCRDGIVVEIRIGGRGTLVVQVFLDDMIHLVVVASCDTTNGDVRQVVVVHVGIFVVGDVGIVALVWVVVHGIGDDALGAVGVVVAKQKHRLRGHIPSVVGVADEVSDGGLVVASAVIHSEDLGGNALVGPELLDAVSQRDKAFIVRRDDHVQAAGLTVRIVLA